MNLLIILPYYVVWHYGKALIDIGKIWKDFLVFVYNFFSIKTLVTTLFSPWKRMGDEYREHGSLEDFMGTLVVNLVMRCLGAVVRLFFIIFGIISLFFTVCLGLVAYVIWFLLPVIFVNIIYLSINILAK